MSLFVNFQNRLILGKSFMQDSLGKIGCNNLCNAPSIDIPDAIYECTLSHLKVFSI